MGFQNNHRPVWTKELGVISTGQTCVATAHNDKIDLAFAFKTRLLWNGGYLRGPQTVLSDTFGFDTIFPGHQASYAWRCQNAGTRSN
jgi:hypothetical protein